MSARKKATISIQDSEYEKNHQEEMASLFASSITQNDIQEIRQQINSSYLEMQNRHKEFETVISSFNSEIASLEHDTTVAIFNHQDQLFNVIEDMAGTIMENNTSIFTDELTRFEEKIERERQIKQNEIGELQNALDEIQQGNNHKKREAQSYLHMAKGMADFIQNNYDVDRFCKKEFRNYRLKVDHSELILEKQIFEAAFLEAFNTFFALSELRLELEKWQSQFNIVHHRTLKYARQLLKLGKELRLIQPVDIDWKPIYDAKPIIVNYWTNDGLRTWMNTVRQIIYQMLSDDPKLTIEELFHISEQVLPKMKTSLENILYQARMKVLSSQIRVNIAAVIVKSLRDMGYQKVFSEYDQQDEKLGYSAHVINLEGNEITIKLDTEEGNWKTNIQLITNNRLNYTGYELKRKNFEILRSLKKFGLAVEDIKTISDVNEKLPTTQPMGKSKQIRSTNQN